MTLGDAFEPASWARLKPEHACRYPMLQPRAWHPVVELREHDCATIYGRYRGTYPEGVFYIVLVHFEVRMQNEAPREERPVAHCESEEKWSYGRHACQLAPGHEGWHRCACGGCWS